MIPQFTIFNYYHSKSLRLHTYHHPIFISRIPENNLHNIINLVYQILFMKNIYKSNFPQKIQQAPEHIEETLLVRLKDSQEDRKLTLQVINSKILLIQKIYTANENQRKQIFATWPNETIQQLYQSNGVIEMKNKCYFIGNISSDMIHGYGLMIYGPKRYYQGAFQNNYKHGEGTQSLINGIYIGTYINNKPQGKGTFYWNNDQLYQGEFLNGLKHGSGMWTSKQQTYTGEWKANKPDGFGIILTKQSRYQGQIRLGIKHGKGKQNFKNGDNYIGGYINGRPDGYGQYSWSNGSIFKGDFKNGLRHGHGIWIKGGDRYQGQYLNDKKNGKGRFIWTSGNVYQGTYFDDLRHGYGQMKWSDGSWYKGSWKNGIQNGQGQMCQRGQPQIRKGIFQNNVLVFEQKVNKKLKIEKTYKKPQKIQKTYENNVNGINQSSQQQQQQHRDKRYEQQELKRQQLKKKIFPSYFSRRTKPIYNLPPARKIQTEKKKDFSLQKLENKMRYNQRQSLQSIKSKSTRKDWHNELNIIQWSNIKNLEPVPLILKSQRYQRF